MNSLEKIGRAITEIALLNITRAWLRP